MNILLDTHTFIWWACEPEHLPEDLIIATNDRFIRRYEDVQTVWD
jgi:PIN domain nuclease of toxin-antitoxin system